MARIFISYRHVEPDEPVARYLHRYLSDLDHEVFYDREDLKTGALWDDVIKKNIEHAQWFIPLISLAYINSPYILDKEWPLAAKLFKQGKIGILPVNMAFDGKPPEAVADIVQPVQFFKWKSPADTPSLAEVISTEIPPPQIMVKGMRPFTETDWGLFQGLGRHEDVTRCLELIKDDSTRFMQIHGVSGAGKTSFIRAGLVPNLHSESVQVIELQDDNHETLQRTATLSKYIFIDQFEQTLIRLSGNDELLRSFLASLDGCFCKQGVGKIVFCIRDEYRTPFDAMLSGVSKECAFFPLLPFEPEVANSVLSALLRNARIQYDPTFLPQLCQELAEGVPKTVTPAILQLVAQYCKNHDIRLNKGSWDLLRLKNRSIFQDHVRDSVLNRLPRRISQLVACNTLIALTSGEVKSSSKTVNEIVDEYKVNTQTVEETLDISLNPQARVITLEPSREDGEQRYRLVHDLFAPAVQALHREAKRQRSRRIRSAVIGSLATLLVITSGALLVAVNQASIAEQQRSLAEYRERVAKQQNYVISMRFAQKEYDEKNFITGLERLNAFADDDIREFYWYHLWRLYHNEILTIKGHRGEVTELAFSDDGKRVISRDREKVVATWDSRTGQQVSSFDFYEAMISPDGNTIANLGSSVITVRDTTRGEEIASLKHDDYVNRLIFSANGRMLLTLTENQTVRVWDIIEGQELLKVKERDFSINSADISADGEMAVTGGGVTMKLWDVHKGKILDQTNVGGIIKKVELAPNGETVAIGIGDGEWSLWDVNSRRKVLLDDLGTHNSNISISPKGKTLVSWDDSGAVKLWDVKSGRIISNLSGASTPIIFSHDGSRLASGGIRGAIKIWDGTNGEEVITLSGSSADITNIAFSHDDKMLAAGDGKAVKLWDLQSNFSGKVVTNLEEGVKDAAISTDGNTLAGVVDSKVVKVWDVRTKQILLELQVGWCHYLALSGDGSLLALENGIAVELWDTRDKLKLEEFKEIGNVNALELSADGNKLVIVHKGIKFGHMLNIWDIKSRQLANLYDEVDTIHSVAVTPNGTKAVSASLNGEVCVWNLRSKQLIKSEQPAGPSPLIVISPDGQFIATAQENKPVIKVWNVQTGGLINTLNGHSGIITSLAFSHDSKTIASGGNDNTLRLWDMKSGLELVSFGEYGAPVIAVEFSPDKGTVSSISSNGLIKQWFAATN